MRQDNAGENKKLAARLKSLDWKRETVMEYTVKATPQQNSYTELGFTVLAARGHATMNHANVPGDMQYQLWPDCINCVTKMDWLTVTEVDGIKKTRCEHYCGKLPKFASYLRTWGEAGTVKIGK